MPFIASCTNYGAYVALAVAGVKCRRRSRGLGFPASRNMLEVHRRLTSAKAQSRLMDKSPPITHCDCGEYRTQSKEAVWIHTETARVADRALAISAHRMCRNGLHSFRWSRHVRGQDRRPRSSNNGVRFESAAAFPLNGPPKVFSQVHDEGQRFTGQRSWVR